MAAVSELPGAGAFAWKRAETRTISDADWRRFEAGVAEILGALGMDTDTEGTRDTPRRFLQALFDATSGYDGDTKLLTAFPSESRAGTTTLDGLIVEGPIDFSALCEHHALPFFGVAYVGYVPSEEIIGISKLTRLVRLYARRFTVQERLGEQIADTLVEMVAPRGVAVHLQASHLCTRMRGVEQQSRTTTTHWRGAFVDNGLRREFLEEARRAERP